LGACDVHTMSQGGQKAMRKEFKRLCRKLRWRLRRAALGALLVAPVSLAYSVLGVVAREGRRVQKQPKRLALYRFTHLTKQLVRLYGEPGPLTSERMARALKPARDYATARRSPFARAAMTFIARILEITAGILLVVATTKPGMSSVRVGPEWLPQLSLIGAVAFISPIAIVLGSVSRRQPRIDKDTASAQLTRHLCWCPAEGWSAYPVSSLFATHATCLFRDMVSAFTVPFHLLKCSTPKAVEGVIVFLSHGIVEIPQYGAFSAHALQHRPQSLPDDCDKMRVSVYAFNQQRRGGLQHERDDLLKPQPLVISQGGAVTEAQPPADTPADTTDIMVDAV
ncbi:autophagy-related protein 9, partial [Kipferlia bialata]